MCLGRVNDRNYNIVIANECLFFVMSNTSSLHFSGIKPHLVTYLLLTQLYASTLLNPYTAGTKITKLCSA